MSDSNQIITVAGAFSTDFGQTWTPEVAGQPSGFGLGGNAPKWWLPCPPSYSDYYGDYFQSAVLPLTWQGYPWIVTGYAMSNTCQPHGTVTFDQHVNTIVW